MASDEASLLDLCSEIIDNRGRTCPQGTIGRPLIATNCIKSTSLYPSYQTERFVSEETYRSWFRGHPEPGDLIFVTKGSPGQVCLAPDPVDFCIAQDMVALRPNPDLVYPPFLLALLRSSAVSEQIGNMHVGTLIPHFKKGDFDKLHLRLPSREIQTTAGDLYLELSKRIDLLRRTNISLEEIPRAIFKSWFVDFDPVRAKAEGREPEGMDATTAALFPSKLDANTGAPQGWLRVPFSTSADVIYGAAFASSQFNTEGNGLRLIRIRDLKTMSPGVWTAEKHPRGHIVAAGDVVVGMDGEFRAYHWLGQPCWLNQRVCAFVTKGAYNRVFIREALVPLLDTVERGQVGTTVIHIGKADIDRFTFFAPPEPAVRAFAAITNQLLEKIVCNAQAGQTLTDLRDTLLPRLTSGKLRITEAEELVEAVL